MMAVAETNNDSAFDAGFTPRRFAAGLALLLLVGFPDVIFSGKTFFHHDFGVFGYPLAYFHRESFWRGEMVPLWNPLSSGGLPFLAQWNTMTFYPGTLFYLLLPLPWSLNVFCIAHLFFAGLGMYFLAHRWTGCGFASAVAGTAFAINGLALSALVWPSNVATYALMPWVVWSVERGVEKGGGALLTAMVLGALQMLTGSPETILFTWGIVGGVSALAWWKKTVSRPVLLLRLALVGLLVAGIAAGQLLPFIDLLRHSQRGAGYGDTGFAMPAVGWINFFMPLFHCHPQRYGVFFQPHQNWVNSYFPGIAILALAIVAVISTLVRRNGKSADNQSCRVGLLAAFALAGATLALGNATFVYPALRQWVPGLALINFPIKFVVLTTFSLPLLAALALAERNSLSPETKKIWRKTTGLVVASIALFLGGMIVFEKWHPFIPALSTTVCASGMGRLLLVIVIFVALWGIDQTVGRRRLLGFGVLLLLAVDIYTHAPRQNPVVPAKLLAPNLKPEALPKLGVGRVWLDPRSAQNLEKQALADPSAQFTSFRQMLLYDLNLLEEIPKADGFFPLYLREMFTVQLLLERAHQEKSGPAFDFLGISHVSPLEENRAWRRRDSARPLILAGQKPVFASGDDLLRGFFATNFAPDKMVFLEPDAKSEVHVTNETAAKILHSKFTAHRVEATVEAAGPAMVTIAQAWFHPWKAYVDGKPVPLWRANHAFQALAVPAGRHEVSVVYEDNVFRFGCLISLLSLAGIATAWRRIRSG